MISLLFNSELLFFKNLKKTAKSCAYAKRVFDVVLGSMLLKKSLQKHGSFFNKSLK